MADISAEVANALHWDFAIPRHRVTAEVDAGVVTLRGIVERAYLRSHAEAIARRIGIVRGDRAVRVITGTDLQDMTDDDLKAELAKPQDVIFARVAPEHKMQVVTALKEMKQIVAVTGDGVNDAPALKKADIGIAMGLSGTDVSREAAIMILLDDSFASIIKAVEQGRGVFANVKKMITYIFSHNMAELFPFVFAVFAGLHLVPLTALQVLLCLPQHDEVWRLPAISVQPLHATFEVARQVLLLLAPADRVDQLVCLSVHRARNPETLLQHDDVLIGNGRV